MSAHEPTFCKRPPAPVMPPMGRVTGGDGTLIAMCRLLGKRPEETPIECAVRVTEERRNLGDHALRMVGALRRIGETVGVVDSPLEPATPEQVEAAVDGWARAASSADSEATRRVRKLKKRMRDLERQYTRNTNYLANTLAEFKAEHREHHERLDDADRVIAALAEAIVETDERRQDADVENALIGLARGEGVRARLVGRLSEERAALVLRALAEMARKSKAATAPTLDPIDEAPRVEDLCPCGSERPLDACHVAERDEERNPDWDSLSMRPEDQTCEGGSNANEVTT